MSSLLADTTNGPEITAVIGALTGVTALLWNILTSMRQGSRLHVTFYVYYEETPDHRGPRAAIDLVNTGTVPVFVGSVGLTKQLPWMRRWPLIRAASFRTRSRWFLRWALGRPQTWFWNVPTEPSLLGRLEPGEARSGRLVDIVNGEPVPMREERIEQLIKEYGWAVAETGLRQYVARLTDNRPRMRIDEADDAFDAL